MHERVCRGANALPRPRRNMQLMGCGSDLWSARQPAAFKLQTIRLQTGCKTGCRTLSQPHAPPSCRYMQLIGGGDSPEGSPAKGRSVVAEVRVVGVYINK